MYLSIAFLYIDGELLKEESLDIYKHIASIPWTGDLFEHFNLVNCIVVQARFAKSKLVITLAHEDHFISFFNLLLANIAVFNIEKSINFAADDSAKSRSF
jgi:hypothetical protein